MRNTDSTSALRVVRPEQADPRDDDAITAIEGFRPLLPDAWYEAKFIGHETGYAFKAPKCFLRFEIVQPGEHLGVRLFRAFRLHRLTGRPGKGGKFVAHAGGELYALLVRLLDIRLRSDRISFRPLRSMLFRVRTRTITTDYAQRERPEHTRYSVIEEIKREQ